MNSKTGLKPELKEMPLIKERISFLYAEKCLVNRNSNALVLKDKAGEVMIPSAQITVLLLGPGTSITHRAIELAGDAGISIVWVGENSIRYYASGRPLTTSSKLLMRQAEFASNRQKHLEVVRRMYSLRFPDEELTGLTLQQLRGKEGARVKKTYREQSKLWNVPWNGRNYDPNDFFKGDPVNQALSAGNVCLYGVAHGVIAALGLSPGLGFIHVGHEKSFV
ncbi:MAG: type I-E CRISPR-associated endonuclease Cas1, partial [Erysipelotrichaceae bacterium]|nr:type I-E CRISPR-associated endonuclease Cas1 [Erysipelotrichaceae bacterium]